MPRAVMFQTPDSRLFHKGIPMLLKLGISLLSLWLLQSSGCESKPAGGQNSPPPAGSSQNSNATNPAGGNTEAKPPAAEATEAGAGRDACALIEASEIEAVQGIGVRQSTPSGRASDGLSVAGCYYMVISADGSKNLSVHLEVTRDDPATSAGQDVLGNLWKQKFEHGIAKKKFDKPKPVAGVGDEAFWSGITRWARSTCGGRTGCCGSASAGRTKKRRRSKSRRSSPQRRSRVSADGGP